MTTLDDGHADAFFRDGDEGTYEGGPGESIPVGTLDLPDDRPTLPTDEQLARRARHTRWVTALVGGLGVLSLLGFSVRALGTSPGVEAVAASGSETEVGSVEARRRVEAPSTESPAKPAMEPPALAMAAVEKPPELAPTPALPERAVEEPVANVAPPVETAVRVQAPTPEAPRAARALPSSRPAPRTNDAPRTTKAIQPTVRATATRTSPVSAAPSSSPAPVRPGPPPTANFPD